MAATRDIWALITKADTRTIILEYLQPNERALCAKIDEESKKEVAALEARLASVGEHAVAISRQKAGEQQAAEVEKRRRLAAVEAEKQRRLEAARARLAQEEAEIQEEFKGTQQTTQQEAEQEYKTTLATISARAAEEESKVNIPALITLRSQEMLRLKQFQDLLKESKKWYRERITGVLSPSNGVIVALLDFIGTGIGENIFTEQRQGINVGTLYNPLTNSYDYIEKPYSYSHVADWFQDIESWLILILLAFLMVGLAHWIVKHEGVWTGIWFHADEESRFDDKIIPASLQQKLQELKDEFSYQQDASLFRNIVPNETTYKEVEDLLNPLLTQLQADLKNLRTKNSAAALPALNMSVTRSTERTGLLKSSDAASRSYGAAAP